jgi:hypothetical protein
MENSATNKKPPNKRVKKMETQQLFKPEISKKPLYIAVGFNVKQDHSLFYFKTNQVDEFYKQLLMATIKHNPDVISIRIVKP